MKRFCALAMTLLLLSGCKTVRPEPDAAPEVPTPPARTQVALFLPDDDGMYLKIEETALPELNAQALVDALTKAHALPEGIKALSFTSETGELDLSGEFSEALNSVGTAGETMRFRSLVNTVLDAFHLDELTVTAEGQVIETGHEVYDGPAGFFADSLEWDDCYYLYADGKDGLEGDDAQVIWEWDAETRKEMKETLDSLQADFQWGYAILNTCGTRNGLNLADDAIIRVEGKLTDEAGLLASLEQAQSPMLFQVEEEERVATRLYALPVGE